MEDCVICKHADLLCYTLMEVVNIKKRVGPSTEPWGTPQLTDVKVCLATFNHHCLDSVPEEAFDPEIGVAIEPIESQLVD